MSSLRSLVYVALILCVGATSSLAQEQAAGTNSKPVGQVKEDQVKEDQVRQVERDWLMADAKGDAASLRRIISDDFIGSTFNGGLLGKEDIIPQGPGPGGFAGATPGETNVRVFDNTGVLMGVINTAGPQAGQIRVTLVFQKRSQGWQMIAAQLTH
jgi:ketosteroid isomerase-like protein